MMYCGNCGKEIVDGSLFCSECGTKIEVAQNVDIKDSNLKVNKTIKRIILFVAIIVVTFIGIKIYSYTQRIPTKEEIQMIANNVQNGAIVASDGKWIYYNGNGLCKMRLKDGSRHSVVSSDIYAEHMFCIGKKLYYYSFAGFYELEGTTSKDLGFSIFTENCFQSDGKRFYVTGSSNYEDGGVYSTKIGNLEKGKKLSDINPTRLLLQGDYLYVLSGFSLINDSLNEYYGTWRMSTNGKDLVSIFDYCPTYLVFSGDRMYYTNEDNNICVADLDGSNETVYEDTAVYGGLNVSDKYIFYISSDNQTIYRMDKDGSNKTELNTDMSGRLNIVGDWIFYENQNYNCDIYKMSFDGTFNQPIY